MQTAIDKTKTMYKANDSVYKRKIRDILYSKTRQHLKGTQPKEFLSLCNTNFELEKKLKNWYPTANMECYEWDKKVYGEAVKSCPNNIKLNYGNIYETDKNKTYDFIWLDLCNSYTEQTINNIVEFLKQLKFNEKSVFALTLNRKRGKSEANLLYSKYFPKYKDEGIVNHLTPFFNRKVHSVNRIEYLCKDVSFASGSMNLFIFKLTK